VTDPFTVRVDSDVLDLAEAFLEHRREEVSRAREALANGDWALLRRIGHELKGTAGSFGFGGLSVIGLGIEQAAEARDRRTAADAVAHMAGYLARVAVIGRPARGSEDA
jgi:HPt (histidine-containing phosphotransfer) domain-containing protein